MNKKQRIVHGQGASNINYSTVVFNLDVCGIPNQSPPLTKSLQKRAHSKTSPVKSWVPLGFARKNDVSKASAAFGVLRTLLRLAILTLSRDNAETIEVGCHCFKC